MNELRGELFSVDRLIEHAAELARSQGTLVQRRTRGPLHTRFKEARVRIRDAYAVLAKDIREGREPSPAEEWLVDNAHVVWDQLREIEEDLPAGYLKELPRIATGVMRDFPRVYAPCIDYLRHTDGRIDLVTLASYVQSYQSVSPLSIGELWAVPIMLRMGLLLIVGALAASETKARDGARGRACANDVASLGDDVVAVKKHLAQVARDDLPINAAFLVELVRRLRERDALVGPAAFWVAAQCARMETTPEELIRREHLRKAADQLSVGNAITSMRAIAAFDWQAFFDGTSAVEAILARDPGGAYASCDDATRDRCRHAIERLARRSGRDEPDVAEAAFALAEEKAGDDTSAAEAHVGHYLIGAGRSALEATIGYRASPYERIVRAIERHATAVYLSSIAAVTLLLIALSGSVFATHGASPAAIVALTMLALVPLSELAVALANGLVVTILPPRLLPKLDYEKGIPPESRTLVVVPAMLVTEDVTRELVEDLEVRALANPGDELRFALLTDFADSDAEAHAGDEALLEHALACIRALDARHGGQHRFMLLHRKRVWSTTQERFMGWERKRGKLEELNRLLRGDATTTFTTTSVPHDALGGVRYVITLDADTELPRDVARKLVGTMAHPLNRPCIDEKTHRVTRGHGILQPRVSATPKGSRRTLFAQIASGSAGIDPYTTAISDVYQDLFDEGSFVGKGIYDIDAFRASVDARIPENAVLSHDLFEGIYARAALVTDIEVLDDQPSSYAVHAARQHRWIRGDVQLVPWLFPKVPTGEGKTAANDLRAIDVWKISDNLRRSLIAPSLVSLLVASWLAGRDASLVAMGIVASVLVMPLVARTIFSLVRASTKPSRTLLGAVGGDLGSSLVQVALGFALLLDQALLCIDAVTRTLDRVFRTKKRMLEWTTMAEVTRRADAWSPTDRRALVDIALSALFGVALSVVVPDSAPVFIPTLLLWACGPSIARALGRPIRVRPPHEMLSAKDRKLFRRIAFKTWRFFERFVTEKESHLPPDNFQEDPRGVVAGRTSPTNIGLYLLSVVAARDLGFIPLAGMLERLGRTLSTMERMDAFEGHLLNWYETASLRPLDPRYVSTVDSGNLAAYLWTLAQACEDLGARPIVSAATVVATIDAIHLALEGLAPNAKLGAREAVDALGARSSSEYEHATLSIGAARRMLLTLAGDLDRALAETTLQPSVRDGLEEARAMLSDALGEIEVLAPFFAHLDDAPASLERVTPLRAWDELRSHLEALDSPAAILAGAERAIGLCRTLQRAADQALHATERTEALAYVSALEAAFERAEDACASLSRLLRATGKRAKAFADRMNFRFLFDEERELFSIGYNVGAGRLDPSHYDLLASEARLASLFAIAKGDVPQAHWFRLSRARTTSASRDVLLSWSGSMFEYLMPLLVAENPRGTLLHETSESAVMRQVQYGRERDVPWGVSESAYNLMDFGMTYQYRAFGVPGLGLKSGLGEDLVIAPYATALAALVRPDLAVANMRALSREGGEGPYGYYESIDYTESRTPPGRRNVVVKAYFAHHQGMLLVALEEVLCNGRMRQRLHRDPRVKATELLLEERIPVRAHAVTPRPATTPTRVTNEPEFEAIEHVSLASGTRAHLLGHGELSTLITSTGDGFTMWRGIDVNRFREDPVLGAGGTYVYLREHGSGRLWSSGYQPTRAEPDTYEAAFSIDKVELRRRDGDIETNTEIVASPEHPAEVRRVTLRNRSLRSVDLDVTTYTEIVLAPRAADVSHRAFSSMFIATEALPERGAVLAMRRPRSSSEPERWVVQILKPGKGDWGALDFDCSRAAFLGREGSLERPSGMDQERELSGSTGMVLDPALVLRRGVRLLPGGSARVSLITAMASSRDEALALIDVYAAPHSVRRAYDLAWADARVELKHLGIHAVDVHRYQRLLTHVIFPTTEMCESVELEALRGRGRSALWAQGISGDLPIIVVYVDGAELVELARELLLAHEFWRLNGMTIDLVILTEEPSGYQQPLEEAVREAMGTTQSDGRLNQRGGVFVRRADQMGDDVAMLIHAARVVLRTSRGSLAKQLRKLGEKVRAPEKARVATVNKRIPEADVAHEPLAFDNGIGGFSGREYTMRIGPGKRTPAPWSNVLSNEAFGTLVTESGIGCTWHGNSQLHRLTPWSNDAVLDPASELIYVRDEREGSTYSMTPRPAGGDATYVVRHGQGFTEFAHVRGDLAHSLTVFVGPDDPVQLARVRIENRGTTPKKLTVVGVVNWVLGSSRETTRTALVTHFHASIPALVVCNPLGISPERRAFFAATGPIESYAGDRADVFGVAGSSEHPNGIERGALSGRVGSGLDPCAALATTLTLEPGATSEVTFLLGEGDGIEHVRSLVRAHGTSAKVEEAWQRSVASWRSLLETVVVRTPDKSLDVLANHWLLYQAIGCRLWGRSGFYQSGGAFGFRDQIQDVLAVLHARPAIAREHLVRAAARQFVEGDVQHWWHADTGQGVRTHCSDDMLWLPYAVAEYVRVTGDTAILDESIPFLTDRTLAVGENDLFNVPSPSGTRASLYEHCTRALDIGTTHGPHGLPKMKGGDWNDGMNRVGENDIGESVWLAWFLAKTLIDFARVARSRGDVDRADRSIAHAKALGVAVDTHAWDGDWYHRAYYDDGTPIGSHTSAQCRIDAIAQSWSVLSGVGDPARARHALDRSIALLLREDDALMLLLTPPFTPGDHNPGYIASYPEGIRENGGQYTHAALWTTQALARIGDGERAVRLLSMINPIHHATDEASMLAYRVEPYVVAADVYGGSGHVGRGGWTWYTGSAS